jgi:hypothetical protein
VIKAVCISLVVNQQRIRYCVKALKASVSCSVQIGLQDLEMQTQDDEFAIGTRGNYRDGRHFELSDGASQVQPGSLLYDAESGEHRRIPRRTCAAAVILLMLGIIMLFTSLAFFVEGHPGYKAFGILGAIGKQSSS